MEKVKLEAELREELGKSKGLNEGQRNELKLRAQQGAAGALNAGQGQGKSRDQLEQEIFNQILEQETAKREEELLRERRFKERLAGREAVLSTVKDRPGSRQTRLSGSFLTGFGA